MYSTEIIEDNSNTAENRDLLRLLQVSASTGTSSSSDIGATGTNKPVAVTSPTGADESMDAPTGAASAASATGAAAAAAEENEPTATTVEPPSSSEDVPLPKTKVIKIICNKKIILNLDTSSLKYSGLAGYALCQAFCVNQYDTSSTPFQGQCMVNGEKFESQEGDEGGEGDDQPILVSEREVDQDPVCVSCSDPPLEKVDVPSFWTEELTKSELIMEEDKSEGMRLPVGRSGHTSTRVDRENVREICFFLFYFFIYKRTRQYY